MLCIQCFFFYIIRLFRKTSIALPSLMATQKNRSKGPVLIGLEEIVQRQVGVGGG